MCADYRKAAHPSCRLTTVYTVFCLPSYARLHTTQTAIFSNTAANNKDKLYISALLLKFKLYQHALCISMHSVSACTLYQHALCISIHSVSACTLYQHALCISMHSVSACTLYQHALCISMHSVSACTLYQHALCISMHSVSACILYQHDVTQN